MASIMFLTSNFIPQVDANGVCVYNLAKALIDKGHSVYCVSEKTAGLCEHEVMENISVYRVSPAWFGQFYSKYANGSVIERFLCKSVHIVRNLCLIPFFPNVSPIRARKVYNAARRICEAEKIDVVIGAFRPYESIYALHKLKGKYGGKVKCIALYLDVHSSKRTTGLGRAFYGKRAVTAYNKDLTQLDRVFVPKANYTEFVNAFGKNEKLESFDFPVYVRQNAVTEYRVDFDRENIHFAYIGTLNRKNRNPEEVLCLFRELKKRNYPVKLHVWGNVFEVKDTLDAYTDVAEYHGFLEYQYVNSVLAQADYLLNILNAETHDMIPSKIFQLFATGKPILNILSNPKDRSVSYFEMYGNACTINTTETDIVERLRLLSVFLDAEKVTVNADELYLENMPEYVADKLICGLVSNEN